MFDTLLFTCAICQREIRDYPTRNGRMRHLEPTCNYCLHVYGRGEPTAGHFMDRRIASQICALAEKLATEAYCLQNTIHWREYGTA